MQLSLLARIAPKTCSLICSAAVAPHYYDSMKALKDAVAAGLAQRIAQACTDRLTFSQPPAGLLIPSPVHSGGLFPALAAGFGASPGALLLRYSSSSACRTTCLVETAASEAFLPGLSFIPLFWWFEGFTGELVILCQQRAAADAR